MENAKQKYKVVIGNKVIVPVVGHYTNGNGRKVQFNYELVCDRMDAEQLREAMSSNALVAVILKEVTTDWRNQRLVLNDDDSAAEFNPDSFDALLNIAGMAMLAFNAYVKHNGATEKN